MISCFDKNDIISHYKRRFKECLEDMDYERALDYLIKYSEERDNPDFHIACGMLYLQMTNDSDDIELLYMAYREFMLQLVRDPDNISAYRDLIFTEFLRTSHSPIFAELCAKHGVDVDSVMRDVMKLTMLGRSSAIDFDSFFLPGDYGEIDTRPHGDTSDEVEPQPPQPKRNKIIKFAGNSNSQPSPERTEKKGDKDKVIPLDDSAVGADEKLIAKLKSAFEKYVVDDDLDEGEEQGADPTSTKKSDDADPAEELRDILSTLAEYMEGDVDFIDGDRDDFFAADAIMHFAERCYDLGKFQDGLDALETISPDDEKYFYAVAMRALLFMESGRYAEAEKSLNLAESIRPHDALTGTLSCRLYEETGRSEFISETLCNIDILTFLNSDHVYKAFHFALKYCDEETAVGLIGDYIDEYNIMSMRLVYAQLMYNRGEHAYAVEELYKLSRIFYDDVNANYYYNMAKFGVDRMPVNEEAPQNLLGVLVEDFMEKVNSEETVKELLGVEFFQLCMEFFLSLEFKNEKRVVRKMFETVRRMTALPCLDLKMCDALVSPYVEPLVKGIILAEKLKRDARAPFLAEIAYKPISSECIPLLGTEYSTAYRIAYAFVVALYDDVIDDFIKLAEDTAAALRGRNKVIDEDALAFYLFKRMTEQINEPFETRYAYAFGFDSKTAANRAYEQIAKIIKEER